jgi:hypothetical protein
MSSEGLSHLWQGVDDSRQPLTSGLGPRREREGGSGSNHNVLLREPLARNGSFTYSVRCIHSSPLLCIIHLLLQTTSLVCCVNLSQLAGSECVIEHRD